MKKLFIISAIVLGAVACTKNDALEASQQQEINFTVASYAGQTKAANKVYDTTVPFGTFAWFYPDNRTATTESQLFMEHETVSYIAATSTTAATWKPAVTYYWPKTGTIDFISYSPRTIGPEYKDGKLTKASDVTVTETGVNFGSATAPYTVGTADVMYADKAIEQHLNHAASFGNYSVVTEGVPTLFHHALANLNVNIKTKYDSKVTNSTDFTTWEVKVTDVDINKIFNQGYAGFTLNTTDKKTWNLPTGSVWTNNGVTINPDFAPASATLVNSTTDTPFVSDYLVLPQNLVNQELVVTVDIKTTLPNGKVITETGVQLKGMLKVTDEIEAWQIGKKITYNLIIVPAASYGTDDEPVAILFDPAVEDWTDATSTEVEITK